MTGKAIITLASGGAVPMLMSVEGQGFLELEEMVEETFEGSLPAFIAAFSRSKKLKAEDVAQLKALIENYQEE